MNKIKISSELEKVINYIKDTIYTEYPTDKITSAYFIISIIDNKDTNGYELLYKNLMEHQILEIREACCEFISSNCQKLTDEPFGYIKLISNELIDMYKNGSVKELNSGLVLTDLLKSDTFASKLFKPYGLTSKQLNDMVSIETENKTKNIKNKKENIKPLKYKQNIINEVEKNLINLNALSLDNKIDKILNNNDVINNIFKILNKKHNNNVILIGDSGIGKTSTIKHIANMINYEKVPKNFKDKILVEIDFLKLTRNIMYKDGLINKFNAVINDAVKSGKYIFFIDDIDLLFNKQNYLEYGLETFITSILDEDKINFVCACSTKGFSKLVENNKEIVKKMSEVKLFECDKEKTYDILTELKEKYEFYHDVIYTKNAIKTCINLSQKYITNKKLPLSSIELMDEIGATISLKEKENTTLVELEKKLNDLQNEKEKIKNGNTKNYDYFDELTKKEIKLKSLISATEKAEKLNKEPITITEKDVIKVVSDKLHLSIVDLNKDEKSKLKTLDKDLKSIVIGQDEAVDEVCKIVKRQRLGLSNPNKPSVLMFTGSTGTGKTYLAKKLAEKIFGSEKYLVRLDMSEYSDDMSVAKLTGSSAGYIGYNDTPFLFEMYYNMKQFVLLLDECEKASDKVFNLFLQVFDEGRLTNNKGETIDLSKIIIILTSNVGAQEASERNGGIGFNRNNDSIKDFDKSIYKKSIKKRFKPEFINRIDSIVYFNRLTDENLRKIIKIHIDNTNNKLRNIGYSLNNDVYNVAIETVLNNISGKKEYGARPILREIENLIENKITDILIDKRVKKGYAFTVDDIFD